jgi:hypothetical protein
MESTNSSQNSGMAKGVVERVRDTASAQISSQKDRATDGLGSLARAIRQSTHALRDSQQDTVAQYAEQAADRLDELSTSLRDRDMAQLIGDAERFARRQPAAFIGASFMLGMLTARFLKSSRAGTDWRTESGGAGTEWRTSSRGSFGGGARTGSSGSGPATVAMTSRTRGITSGDQAIAAGTEVAPADASGEALR